MIQVGPSPILFYFNFFIRSESIRIDPTRTGSPSWSGPTFVPASFEPAEEISMCFPMPEVS